MIIFEFGDIFDCDVEALVNPVNCVGVMGKGLAAQFKRKYPRNFEVYRQYCKQGLIKCGKVHVVDWPLGVKRSKKILRFIINFPTKRHWSDLSRIKWIIDGLEDLRQFLIKEKVKSIAIPPIGCGLGGLNWDDVYPLIYKTFKDVDGVDVHIFPPHGRGIPADKFKSTQGR